jgi:hypothetical protein
MDHREENTKRAGSHKQRTSLGAVQPLFALRELLDAINIQMFLLTRKT